MEPVGLLREYALQKIRIKAMRTTRAKAGKRTLPESTMLRDFSRRKRFGRFCLYLRANLVLGSCADRLYRVNEPIAAAADGFNKPWVFGRIVQCSPEPPYGGIQGGIKFDIGFRPEPTTKLLAANQCPRTRHKDGEQSERMLLNFLTEAVLASSPSRCQAQNRQSEKPARN